MSFRTVSIIFIIAIVALIITNFLPYQRLNITDKSAKIIKIAVSAAVIVVAIGYLSHSF